MKYGKSEAKEYARERMKGLWGASLTPFTADLVLDESAFRANLRHWFDDTKLGGLFVSGKQGEFFSMSLEERKRTFEIAVEEARGGVPTILSCWDMNLDNTLELIRHSERIGADFVIVQNPILYFASRSEAAVYEYFKHLAESTRLGIALWNNPDHGYSMSPELCSRLADIPNIVAIKDSVPREEYVELSRIAGDRILVSSPSEVRWLDNILELGWRLYLASPEAFAMQSKVDRRLTEYTDLAIAGDAAAARSVCDSLEPVREAIRSSRPLGKDQAHFKYWIELQGLIGGPVRPPLMQLTEEEKATVRTAFASSGLQTAGPRPSVEA